MHCYPNNGSFCKYLVGCSYNTGNQTLHQIYQTAETLPCVFFQCITNLDDIILSFSPNRVNRRVVSQTTRHYQRLDAPFLSQAHAFQPKKKPWEPKGNRCLFSSRLSSSFHSPRRSSCWPNTLLNFSNLWKYKISLPKWLLIFHC